RWQRLGRPPAHCPGAHGEGLRAVREGGVRPLPGEGQAGLRATDLPEPAEAIAWIRAARGLPVLAHPTWVRESAEGLSKLCEKLKGAGLMGIEAHYSTHKPQQTADYLDLARRLDLLVTGGSDFHGLTKPDIEVGLGRGGLTVPEKLLEP